jgi:hypothetical protein
MKLETFSEAKKQFLELQKKAREKWNQYPKIFQLIDLLRKGFNANLGAKNVLTRGQRCRCYGRKDRFMQKAIELAKEINLPFFFWGCQYDRSCINYEVVLYFQIGSDQISFHTHSLFDAIEFPGSWIGIEQYTYPFSISKVKKLAFKGIRTIF